MQEIKMKNIYKHFDKEDAIHGNKTKNPLL